MSSRKNLYETSQYLGEYLLFHYGKPKEFCAFAFAPRGSMGFHRRIVTEMVRPVRARGSRALDLGCAVGRVSFELSLKVDEVIGIDFSRNFVRAAGRLAKKRRATFKVSEEGGFTSQRTVSLDKKYRRHRVQFEVGDAQKLRSSLGAFDVVVMANLIDRLPDPKKCLRQLAGLVKPGGQLVITSPYSWLEQYTPKKNWLAGKSGTTLDSLRKLLRPHFKLVRRRDLPFLIREHRRKYQWVVAEATAWRRTSVR